MNTPLDIAFDRPDRAAALEEFRTQEREQLKVWIEEQVWEAADDIGQGYGGLDKYSPEQLAAYARGQRRLLEPLADRNEMNVGNLFLQFEAAIGERMRRLQVSSECGMRSAEIIRRGKLRRRLFNNLIEQIRDKRIAMLDRYELLDYKAEYTPWRNRVWAWERRGVEQKDWDEFNQVRQELDALWSLSHHLTADRSWFAKHYELRSKANAGPAQEAAA